ncbi:uncharacterized protein LOC121385586 [Gigantopelta aegis]|uniref:uncharacterized protein LOC121385586 n=1 Tax=Gigantopelta aegis TaxID=1735272 RepID=UPI001B8885B0|nr:uncharacterized protein LOC121385586 [Gigantopelta aegis]
MSHSTVSDAVSLADTQTHSDDAVIGGTVAAVAVVMLLVSVLLAVVWMKRMRRGCFIDKSSNADTHARSGGDGFELTGDQRVQSDHRANEHSSRSETGLGGEDNQHGIPDYEYAKPSLFRVSVGPRTVNEDEDGDYDELHANTGSKSQQGDDRKAYSHIHSLGDAFLSSDDPYDRAMTPKVAPSNNATYSHMNEKKFENAEDDYDELHASTQMEGQQMSNSDAYSHIHSRGGAGGSIDTTLAGVFTTNDETYNNVDGKQLEKDDEEDDYDELHSTDVKDYQGNEDEAYSHIQSAREADTYDRTTFTKQCPHLDATHSHMDRNAPDSHA